MPNEIESIQNGLSRRGVIGNAALLGVAAVGLTASQLTPSSAIASPVVTAKRKRGTTGTKLRWLGVGGFELQHGENRILIDPYLSRIDYANDDKSINEKAKLDVAEAVIDKHIAEAPRYILVTHGHFDHMMDVPYLMERHSKGKNAPKVFGTETHHHLLNAYGVDPKRCVTVSGGEYLDAADLGMTIQVFRSLHSQSAGFGYLAPYTLDQKPKKPKVIGDLVEGGTLAYQVTIADQLKVMFISGATNFIEREIAGEKPDVLVLSMSGSGRIHRYAERALSVLGGPSLVIPCHHDDMTTALDDPDLPSTVGQGPAQELLDAASKLGLSTQVHNPKHLDWIEL